MLQITMCAVVLLVTALFKAGYEVESDAVALKTVFLIVHTNPPLLHIVMRLALITVESNAGLEQGSQIRIPLFQTSNTSQITLYANKFSQSNCQLSPIVCYVMHGATSVDMTEHL